MDSNSSMGGGGTLNNLSWYSQSPEVIFTFNVQSLDGPLILYLNSSWEFIFAQFSKCWYQNICMNVLHIFLLGIFFWGEGGCMGLIPLKPQNPSKLDILTASSHLIYGKKLKIKIWNLFSNIIDHFEGVHKKTTNNSLLDHITILC